MQLNEALLTNSEVCLSKPEELSLYAFNLAPEEIDCLFFKECGGFSSLVHYFQICLNKYFLDFGI